GQLSRVRMAVNAEHAAIMFWVLLHRFSHRSRKVIQQRKSSSRKLQLSARGGNSLAEEVRTACLTDLSAKTAWISSRHHTRDGIPPEVVKFTQVPTEFTGAGFDGKF